MHEPVQAERALHPAAHAWEALGGPSSEAIRIEPLVEKGKSRVYRLSSRAGSGSVIAKRCRMSEAWVERAVYEDILPQVPVPKLAYHGFVADPDGDHGWLVVEDAGDRRPSLKVPAGKRLLTRWVATLHTAAAGLPAVTRLPERGAAHYLEHLRAARDTIRQHYDNPELQGTDREVLDSILGELDIVEPRWDEVEASCAAFPSTLVHGDLVAQNLRLRRAGAAPALVTFDWEMAGQGVPVADLMKAEPELYAALVRDTWPGLDASLAREMVRVGKLFRGVLAPIRWMSLSLEYPWVEHPMILLRYYEEHLRESLGDAGWAA